MKETLSALVFDLRDATDRHEVRQRFQLLSREVVGDVAEKKIGEFLITYFTRLEQFGEASGLWRGLYIEHESPDVISIPCDGRTCIGYEVTRFFPGGGKKDGERNAKRDRLYRECMDRINEALQLRHNDEHLSVLLSFRKIPNHELKCQLNKIDANTMADLIVTTHESGSDVIDEEKLHKHGILTIRHLRIHRHTHPAVERSIGGWSRKPQVDHVLERISSKKRILETCQWNRPVEWNENDITPQRLVLILYDEIHGDFDLVDEYGKDLGMVIPDAKYFDEVIIKKAFDGIRLLK